LPNGLLAVGCRGDDYAFVARPPGSGRGPLHNLFGLTAGLRAHLFPPMGAADHRCGRKSACPSQCRGAPPWSSVSGDAVALKYQPPPVAAAWVRGDPAQMAKHLPRPVEAGSLGRRLALTDRALRENPNPKNLPPVSLTSHCLLNNFHFLSLRYNLPSSFYP